MPSAPATSPPKRVTRARTAAKISAKNAKTTNPESEPTLQPIVRKRRQMADEDSNEANNTGASEPVRKSARRAAATAPARRIKITPLAATANSQQEVESPDRPAKKPRTTRSKKATTDAASHDQTESTEEPAKHTRQAGQKAKEIPKPSAPKVRGRPRKTAPPLDQETKGQDAEKRSSARAGSGTTATRAMTKAPSRVAIPKKVMFHGVPECDKENQVNVPCKSSTNGQAAAPAAGLRAKPVRRPAASTKAKANQIPPKEAPRAETQRVLTPKKVTQVAKALSPARSDEDELSGAKTPVRDLSKSPRRNPQLISTVSPVKKLDFSTATGIIQSPVNTQIAAILSSPARRPAPSPYKDSLKESPRRGDVLFKQSHTANVKEDGSYQQSCSNNMLLQSPKRAAMIMPAFQLSPTKIARSPSKASLLRSPPKRMVATPAKSSCCQQTKSPTLTPTMEAASGELDADLMILNEINGTFSPGPSSTARTATSETVSEDAKPMIDFDQSVFDIRSPLKLEGKTLAETQQTYEVAHNFQLNEDVVNEGSISVQKPSSPRLYTCDLTESDRIYSADPVDPCRALTAAPANIMLQAEPLAGASSFFFRTSPIRDQEESSDDELQSPIRMPPPETPSPAPTATSIKSQSTAKPVAENAHFTPLATQLSGWFASSPEKGPKSHFHEKSMFSPVAAQHVPGEIIIDRNSPAASRVSTEPSSAPSARKSALHRQSVGGRRSLGLSAAGTPHDKSSFFADEMAIQDLEDKMEVVHEGGHEVSTQGEIRCLEDILSHNSAILDLAGTAEEVDTGNAVRPDGVIFSESAETNITISQYDIRAESCGLDQDEATVQEACGSYQGSDSGQDPAALSTYDDENHAPTTPPSTLVGCTPMIDEQNGNPCVRDAASLHEFDRQEDCVTPFQPQRPIIGLANTVVSKVPLRPEGDFSPVKMTRKRSRSVSAGPLSVRKTRVSPARRFIPLGAAHILDQTLENIYSPASSVTTLGNQSFAIDDFGDSTLDAMEIDADDENLPPATPVTAGLPSCMSKTPTKPQTPARSSQALQGAVVFVDVHTTEGADASGIFTELLTQMGARCVTTWSWNPRASIAVNAGDAPSDASSSKIGITHVVFKDGGMRTLEKVRDTEGMVKCIGVGWVLDCERENKRLDESKYAVDISIVPRGGSRRRKSMEPRALLNINGSLSKAKVSAGAAGRRSLSSGMTQQMRDELVHTPVRGRSDIRAQEETSLPEWPEAAEDEESGFTTPTGLSPPVSFLHGDDDADLLAPATPTGFVAYDPADPAFQTPAPVFAPTAAADISDVNASPTTPQQQAFQNNKLIQMTCPPKQTMKGLFSTTPEEEQREPTNDNEKENLVSSTANGVIGIVGNGGSRGAGSIGSDCGSKAEEDAAQANAKLMRRRLLEARRRTLGWKPVVGSPLRRC